MVKASFYKILALTFVLSTAFAVNILYAAWSNPTCDPSVNPAPCNVATPLNVGSTAQTKSGKLNLTASPSALNIVGNADILGNLNAGTGYFSANLGVGGAAPGGAPSGAQNLVIGTTGGNNTGITIFTNATSGGGLVFTDVANAYRGRVFYNNTDDSLQFYTAGASAPRLYINNNGNVGIGTTNPTQKLDIAGSINLTGGSTVVSNSFLTLQSGAGQALAFNTGGASERMRIDSAGNVGIGTAAPTQKVDVVGYVRGSSGLCIGSDCRTSWPASSGGVVEGASIGWGQTFTSQTSWKSIDVNGAVWNGSNPRPIGAYIYKIGSTVYISSFLSANSDGAATVILTTGSEYCQRPTFKAMCFTLLSTGAMKITTGADGANLIVKVSN